MQRDASALLSEISTCHEVAIRLDERMRCATIGIAFFGGIILALQITSYVMLRGL